MGDRVYCIDKWGNKKELHRTFSIVSATYGTKLIEDIWYTVHTVRNQFFDKFNLLTNLKLDSKAFQNHIFWKFSQKTKCIKLMDDNLQGC